MMTTMASVETLGCKSSKNVLTNQKNSLKANDADDFMTMFSEIVNNASVKSKKNTKTETEKTFSEKCLEDSQQAQAETILEPAKEKESENKEFSQAYLSIPAEFILKLPNEIKSEDTSQEQPIRGVQNEFILKLPNEIKSEDTSQEQPIRGVQNEFILKLPNEIKSQDTSQEQHIQNVQNVNPKTAELTKQLVETVEVVNDDVKAFATKREGFEKVLDGVDNLKYSGQDAENKVDALSKNQNQLKDTLTQALGKEKSVTLTAGTNLSQKIKGSNDNKTDDLKEAKGLKLENTIEVKNQANKAEQIKGVKTESTQTQSLNNQNKEFSDGFEPKQKISFKESDEVKPKQDIQLDFIQPKLQVEKTVEIADLDVKTIEGANVANQVSDQVSSVIKEGESTFKMKLNPEGLGEIKVNMTCKDGKVSLEIVANNKITQQLLQNQSHELKSALGAKNYEVLNLDVVSQTNTDQQANTGFSFSSGNSFNNNQQYKQTNYDSADIVNEANEETINFTTIDQSGRLNYTA